MCARSITLQNRARLALLSLLVAVLASSLAHAQTAYSFEDSAALNLFAARFAQVQAIEHIPTGSAIVSGARERNFTTSPLLGYVTLQLIAATAEPSAAPARDAAKLLGFPASELPTHAEHMRRFLARLSLPAPLGRRGAAGASGEETVPFQAFVAGGAWANSARGQRFSDAYSTFVDVHFRGRARSYDFGSPAAAVDISRWIQRRTSEKVRQTVDFERLQDASVSFIGGFAFTGSWRDPFDRRRSDFAPFYKRDGSRITMHAMSARLPGYFETSNSQVMELPFHGGAASMYVILPKRRQDPAEEIGSAIDRMSNNSWTSLFDRDANTRSLADITLPKFALHSTEDAHATFWQMGLIGPFTDILARMNQVSAERSTRVSLIRFGSAFSVSEQGAELNQVEDLRKTLEGVRLHVPARLPRQPPNPMPQMIVDRPFIAVITVGQPATIVALAVVCDPTDYHSTTPIY